MSVSIDLTNPETRKELDALKPASGSLPSLIGMSREDMADALSESGVPEKQIRMRVSQIWHWLYIRGVSDFADMKNLSKDFRAMLAEKFEIGRPKIIEEQILGRRRVVFIDGEEQVEQAHGVQMELSPHVCPSSKDPLKQPLKQHLIRAPVASTHKIN